MLKLILITILLFSNVQAKLLDKVAGVINDKIITLSEIHRIQNTLAARTQISPMIYKSKKLSEEEILEIINRIFIIKDKLSALGFVIGDDNVESRIQETESMRRITRDQLLRFLESEGINFSEYFEIVRTTMEYNIFASRIISPLVSITDQEMKNFYYKQNAKNKTLSFKYTVVDFYLKQEEVPTSEVAKLPEILANYQKTGNLPEGYRNLQTNNLGTLSSEDLPKDLSKLLAGTEEGGFSVPFNKGGAVHTFFVKKKELTESEDYLKNKNYIHNELFSRKADSIIDSWFAKEKSNYYILNNL